MSYIANYYISDLHFGHANVIKFDNRPFNSVEEMDLELMRRWNSVVLPGDTVYVLGDMIWKNEARWPELLKELKGNKVLIIGNHDLKHYSGKVRKCFQDIKELKTIHDGDYEVVMCHYPILFYPHSYNPNTIMLCGHVHVTRENLYLEAFRDMIRANYEGGGDNRGRIINVGCMMPWMDYTPRTLEEILERTGL